MQVYTHTHGILFSISPIFLLLFARMCKLVAVISGIFSSDQREASPPSVRSASGWPGDHRVGLLASKHVTPFDFDSQLLR